jgi:hypothetical protein
MKYTSARVSESDARVRRGEQDECKSGAMMSTGEAMVSKSEQGKDTGPLGTTT